MHYFGASLLTILGLVNNLKSVEVNNITNRWPSGPRAKLEITPEFVTGLGQKVILRKHNESLNMTCTVVPQHPDKSDISLDYDVVWTVPLQIKGSRTYTLEQRKNIAWLWFERLSERDAGDYGCHAVTSKFVAQQVISINIHLSIKKSSCGGEQWFNCSSSICIMQRYVCDGKIDCANGEDELGCGSDPCLGRVLCNGRCVPPEWCCGHRNCSGTYGLRPWPPETPEISYVQTAFYTVIGCAMAFMFIVTILVIAICRVQIKRAMNSRWTQQNRTNCNRRRTVPIGMPIYDLDVYLNRTANNYPRGVSIMYNINSGVQFVGRPVEPPPYSEVVASPPREGPPPPYVSCENLMEQTTTMTGEISESISATHQTDSIVETSNPETMAHTINDLREEPPVFSGVVITSRSIPGPQVPTVSHISSTNSNVDNSSNNRAARTLPQTFDLEYVETDALLSDNANITITSPKETVWKTYSRPGIGKNRWQDPNSERRWYQRKSDSKSVESSPLRNKDLSLADSENEGVFLDTDQQEIAMQGDSGPSTSIHNNETDKNFKKTNEPNDQNVDSSTLTTSTETFPANASQLTCAKTMNESSTNNSSPIISPSEPQTEVSGESSANESLVLPLRESFIGVQKNS